jgi:dolichyl-phosphate-mannose-protein mannosyltransferase
MLDRRTSYANWIVLFLIAALPRMLGAFFLPNAFGDAYVYIQEIGTLSTKISNGSFRLTDLFGFWLPLYQLIAALLNVAVRNGFYSGKIVAALFGALTCVFAYRVTLRLTHNRTAALWMFLLLALNPLHIFYSASAMTDVPHACFVLAALYFLLSGNWIVAAVFAALAGFTRVESWMLIALIPFIQFVRERRLSIGAIIILVIPPWLWFYISWKATGNWLACFVQRQQYHDWLMQMNPALKHFSLASVSKDTAMLLVSSDIAVLIASLVAGWFVIKSTPQFPKSRGNCDTAPVWPSVLFFFAFLTLLLVAYVTHQQPIIFPRYGLILFTLGLPILAWTFLHVRKMYPQSARKVLVGIIAILILDASIQSAGAAGAINQYRVQRAVADYLRIVFDPNSDARIFCDEGTVRVLSGIPGDRFITSSQVHGDDSTLRSLLQAHRVEYVVVADVQGSVLGEAMHEASRIRLNGFEIVFHGNTRFLPTSIWLLKAPKPNMQ